MGEHEIVEKVKSRQGVLSKIQNFFTLGYGTKEDIRELDKQVRDLYYIELRNMRHIWEEVNLKILEGKVKVSNRDIKKVLQGLDRVMEKIHRARYGYAGLYDRKGHIREKELSRVLNFDKELEENVINLSKAIQKVQSNVENEKWIHLSNDLNIVKTLLSTLENNWNDRKNQFRTLKL